MDLSRISSRTWLRMILGLVAFILIAFFLNKLHKRSQSYEGVVVRIYWIRAVVRPSLDVLLARIETREEDSERPTSPIVARFRKGTTW